MTVKDLMDRLKNLDQDTMILMRVIPFDKGWINIDLDLSGDCVFVQPSLHEHDNNIKVERKGLSG